MEDNRSSLPTHSYNAKAVLKFLNEHGKIRNKEIAKGIGKHEGATYNALRALKWHKMVVQNEDKTWELTDKGKTEVKS